MQIAYFSMEYGISQELPIYSGGLGVLAGDTLKSCADLNVPIVAIGLLYTYGYFRQKIKDNHQCEFQTLWNFDNVEKIKTFQMTLEKKPINVAIYKYDVVGKSSTIPLYLLSTDIDGNEQWQREITHNLYRADHKWWRIAQEIILGIGGVIALSELSINPTTYHLNEGHAAFSILQLYKKFSLEEIKNKVVFTTHTPVTAGHDRFNFSLVNQLLPQEIKDLDLKKISLDSTEDGQLNMSLLAINNCRICNGVSNLHAEVSKKMFSKYADKIIGITNGVHSSWQSQYISELEDYQKLSEAHIKAKKDMINKLNLNFDIDILTIGFCRRFASYKRPDLIFSDIEKLKTLKYPVQIVFSGKAHPQDNIGKEKVQNVMEKINLLSEDCHIKTAFVENYNIDKAKYLVSGVDLWLNNPLAPFEASGTSGMKAALNGVPSLSINDGWWCEHFEGTGWTFGDTPEFYDETDLRYEEDSKCLYQKLSEVLEIFYNRKEIWNDYMVRSIKLNGTYFNTDRMVKEYLEKMWK